MKSGLPGWWVDSSTRYSEKPNVWSTTFSEVEAALHLAFDLVTGAENMGVVLREAAKRAADRAWCLSARSGRHCPVRHSVGEGRDSFSASIYR